MTCAQRLTIGLLLMAIGGAKTWLHTGAIPMLALPTCTGNTVYISAHQSSWFEQAHCWGCYALLMGVLITVHAVFRQVQKRRSVALIAD